MMKIDIEYRNTFPVSERLFERAQVRIPSGITHDIRRLDPFPLYVSSAIGARKLTADGVELIDYGMGHGALMFGHNPSYAIEVLDRCRGQTSHFSAGHPAEVGWAEWICRLVPSAEKVRFTLSGTEATQLAMRLARAATGRAKILRLTGHYHGWHDYALLGHVAPFDRPSSAGIPEATLSTVVVAASDDLDEVEQALRTGEIAALILEPSGSGAGAVPVDTDYLRALRGMTARHGSLLIFDEVITGFRWAPGGAQEWFGITPDLTTLGKIVSGGAPGAAVAGRADILDLMAYRIDADWNRYSRIFQNGTWNAYPESAELGVATLERLVGGSVQDAAADLAATLRAGMHEQIRITGFSGCVYGHRSAVRVVLDESGAIPNLSSEEFVRAVPTQRLMHGTPLPLRQMLWKANLLEGIDWLSGDHGWLSAAHTTDDVSRTIDAFGRALHRVASERRRASGESPVLLDAARG